MNEKCYDAVINEMKPLLDGQKFVCEGEVFKNEKKAVRVSYDESAKVFVLSLADVTEDSVGDFAVASTWLFDENQTEKDAAAVGVDFADTLRQALGLKAVRGTANVALPTAEKGESINILTLTQKLLAMFPEFKEDYKREVALYGKFLYVDFFTEKFVPQIKALIASGNKKQLKKLFDMLDEMYVNGDSATTDMVISLIAASVYGDEKNTATAAEYMAENTHMKICVNELLSQIKKNKKLKAALIK